MKLKIFNTILFFGYFYLVNIFPDEYFWIKVIFMVLILAWVWLGEKIFNNDKK